MTEQDDKAMMADSNPRTQTAPAHQNQPTQHNTAQISNDIANITKPNYLYNEDDIKKY